MSDTVLVSESEMKSILLSILNNKGFKGDRAETCAHIFTQNSLDGVYTHGIYRFLRFVGYIEKGYVQPNLKPEMIHSLGALERWDGHKGSGPNNALDSTYRAMELAQIHGIGCVGLSNTNHWMRGGYYGWEAAKKGFLFMGWTNTIANMPAWGAKNCKLGNNPIVLAISNPPEAVVLDMAMSQFSYGAMEVYQLKNQELPIAGGFDTEGKMTKNPKAILESQRSLPIGYWKGAGLSVMLDLFAAVLSGGDATFRISQHDEEYGVSQVFIAVDLMRLGQFDHLTGMVESVINDLHSSIPASEYEKIYYPGERVLQKRQENARNGIPVERKVWVEILSHCP